MFLFFSAAVALCSVWVLLERIKKQKLTVQTFSEIPYSFTTALLAKLCFYNEDQSEREIDLKRKKIECSPVGSYNTAVWLAMFKSSSFSSPLLARYLVLL